MRFSIIVQVHNNAPELASCVSSLLEQDCRDLEILLVDQGSTDDSPMLCDGYAAVYPGVIHVIHRDNGNPNSARNAGLEKARGEYVLFLNRCDLLEPSALACLSRYVDETQADLYLFGSSDLEGERLSHGRNRPTRQDGLFSLQTNPAQIPVNPEIAMGLWRKRLFDDSGIRFGRSTWYADFETAVKLLPLCTKVAAIPDRLTIRRRYKHDAMQSPRRCQELMETLERLQGYFFRQGLDEACRRWLGCAAVEQVLQAAERILHGGGERNGLRALGAYLNAHFPGYETEPMLGKHRAMLAQMLKNGQYFRLKMALSRKSRG